MGFSVLYVDFGSTLNFGRPFGVQITFVYVYALWGIAWYVGYENFGFGFGVCVHAQRRLLLFSLKRARLA